MSVMTTKDNFPVVDITHRPKRLQGDNLKTLHGESSPDSPVMESSKVPQIVTMERAITFYESHAEGEYARLYAQTAKWLREFMSKTIPVPDRVDIDKAQAMLDKVRRGN